MGSNWEKIMETSAGEMISLTFQDESNEKSTVMFNIVLDASSNNQNSVITSIVSIP
jgi:hypothetical protein